ncbi:MAG: hypothetical protein ACI9DF_002454 [Verrucomicrobiales bacterium]
MFGIIANFRRNVLAAHIVGNMDVKTLTTMSVIMGLSAIWADPGVCESDRSKEAWERHVRHLPVPRVLTHWQVKLPAMALPEVASDPVPEIGVPPMAETPFEALPPRDGARATLLSKR